MERGCLKESRGDTTAGGSEEGASFEGARGVQVAWARPRQIRLVTGARDARFDLRWLIASGS